MLRWLSNPQNPTREKEWKLTVHDAICLRKGTYGHPTPTEWPVDRFQQWHEQGVAIVSGSTYAERKEQGEEKVLDAAAGRKYYDENGVLKRTVLMTLDGLGHASHFEGHQQISGDNKLMVTEFDKALPPSGVIDLTTTLTTAGKAVCIHRDTEQKSATRGKRPVIENGSAIAVAVIEHDEKKDQMRCHLANMGDTIAIVLDKKTLAIKKMLPARQYEHNYMRDIVSCPIPAHLIEHNPEALLSETVDVSPDDVVVLMTDGISDELKCETKEQKLEHKKEENDSTAKHPHAKIASALSYREVQLTTDALEAALAPLKFKEQASEYEIATAIVEYIESQLISSRAADVKLQEEFNQWINLRRQHIGVHINEVGAESAGEGGMTQQNKDQYTMQQWFAWKEKHSSTEADQKYPFSEFKKDLEKFLPFVHVCFPATKDVRLEDRTILGLFGNLVNCQPRSGDCTTLSVMRIPDPDVELVRAWVDFSENREQLLPRLIKRITKQKEEKSFDVTAWREKIVAKLEAEKYIAPGSRGKADTVIKQPVYQAEQLMEARYAIQKAAHLQFIGRLENKESPINVTRRNAEFEEFKATSHLIHRHTTIDWIFGIKNTASWKNTIGKIRTDALAQLDEELKAQDDNEKIALLKRAREMAIFKDHRNNSVFFGAFGRTQAVQGIDEKIENLERRVKKS